MPDDAASADPQRTGTLEWLVGAAAAMLRPLATVLTADQLRSLLCVETGVLVDASALDTPALTAALASIANTAGQLDDSIATLTTALSSGDTATGASAASELLIAVQATVSAVSTVAQALNAPLPGLTSAQLASFVENVAARVLEMLAIDYLDRFLIRRSWLVLFGLLDQTLVPSDPSDPTQPSFVREQLHMERAFQLLSAPLTHARNIYGWGDTAFQADVLLARLQQVLVDHGVTATFTPATATAPSSLDVLLFTVRAHDASPVPGLEIELDVPISSGFSMQWPLSGGFAVQLSATCTIDSTMTLVITPPADLTWPLVTTAIDGDLQVGLVGASEDPTTPFVVLGATGGSRLEAKQLSLSAGISATTSVATSGASSAHAAVIVEASITGGRIVLDTSGGDGFLASFLSGQHIEADLDFDLTWSPQQGLIFKGGAGLEVVLQVNRAIGPIQFQTLKLGATLDSDAARLPIEISASLSGQLGPLTVTVDSVGLETTISFPHAGGNLGPFDFQFAFKPPDGLGLAVNADLVSGGGFLAFDATKQEYTGALALAIENIAVGAFGSLDTNAPGGYSLAAVIEAQFQAIQLGLGFTLSGVGGLVAIHRQVDTDALRAALQAKGIDDIFFPSNPIAQAARLIGDLGAYFPEAPGRYVFGPAAKIGWGTPTLVTGELAILLELPDPVRVVLLGSVSAALPTKDHPLVVLNVEVLGVIDFAAKTLAIDASLVNSKVITFPITGDFALRLGWGDSPSFVLSVGGFHSQFTPPPGFPTLRRVQIPIGAGNNPRLDAQGFLAITSNTAQVGAQIDLYVAAGPLSLTGSVGFEALFQFSPFSFEIDLSAGVALKRGSTTLAGVQLDGTLSGPAPWHITGEASLSLWFMSLSVPFSATFGQAQSVEVPQMAVWPLLQAALQAPTNWSAALPDGAARAVTTAPPVDDTSGAVRVDPVGALVVRQTVCPLDQTITKFGQATPSGPNEFTVTSATLGAAPATFTAVTDYFAAAQFEELSDADKLSRPGYELMTSGVSLATAAVRESAELTAPLSYDTTLVVNGVVQPAPPAFRPTLAAQLLGCARSANASAPLRTASSGGTFAAPALLERGGLPDDSFVIASAATLTARTDLASAAGRGAIERALAAHLAATPGDAGALIVVPSYELAA